MRALAPRGISLAGLQGDLGFAVAIEIVNDHRRGPSAQLDGPAQIVAP